MHILVSACLLGEPCRYDGGSKPCAAVRSLSDGGHVLHPVCPEVDGGLPTPRVPCEVVESSTDARVVSARGVDCTDAYRSGARHAVEAAQREGCSVAVLKAKSPACGSGRIYDGTFSGVLRDGWGIAAAALRDVGVRVVDEEHVANLGL